MSSHLIKLETLNPRTIAESIPQLPDKVVKLPYQTTPSSFENIGNIKKLKMLNASGNQILTIGPGFENLLSLQSIDLSKNVLVSILSGVGKLKNLSEFVVSNNRLESLPEELGDCSKLKVLLADNNKLKTLPSTLLLADSLSRLRLEGNRMTKKQFLALDGSSEFMLVALSSLRDS